MRKSGGLIDGTRPGTDFVNGRFVAVNLVKLPAGRCQKQSRMLISVKAKSSAFTAIVGIR